MRAGNFDVSEQSYEKDSAQVRFEALKKCVAGISSLFLEDARGFPSQQDLTLYLQRTVTIPLQIKDETSDRDGDYVVRDTDVPLFAGICLLLEQLACVYDDVPIRPLHESGLSAQDVEGKRPFVQQIYFPVMRKIEDGARREIVAFRFNDVGTLQDDEYAAQASFTQLVMWVRGKETV